MSTLKLKSKFNPIVQILNGNEKHQKANIKLLSDAITKGFKPKWYCVLHFNDGGISNKHKKSTRAKSVWSIEYGDNPDKPHINLIIESLPYPYNDYRSFYVLIDRFLPIKCKRLSGHQDMSHVQPINDTEPTFSYITKESDYRNSTLIHQLNDY